MKIEETLYAFAVRLGTGEPAYEARLLARDEEDAVRLAREAALQSWRGILVPTGVTEVPDPSLLATLAVSEEPHMGSGTRRIMPPMSAAICRLAGERKDAGKAYRTLNPQITALAKGRAEEALERGWARGAEDYVLSVRAEYDGGSSVGARLNGAGHFRNVQRHAWARNAPPASASARAAWAAMSAARAGQSARGIAAFLREIGDDATAKDFAGA